MKHTTKLAVLAMAMFAFTAMAQFRRSSDGAKYPYLTNLQPSDVFIIGRPGDTNYNFASSNLLAAIGGGTNTGGGGSQTPWLSDINAARHNLTNVSRMAQGGSATIASGSQSHAEGENTIASGISAHSEGYYTTAIGDASHAEGRDTTAIGFASHADGRRAITEGAYSYLWNGDDTQNITNALAKSFRVHSPAGIGLTGGPIYGNASGVSNAVTLIAGENVTITTNADNRTFTITSAASGSAETTDLYTNVSATTLAESGEAIPYPSTIVASGIAQTITSVSVGIEGFNHAVPSDIVIVLISPSGHQIKLMEGCGSVALPGGPGGYVNLVFSDSASAYVPAAIITNGAYLPTVRDPVSTPSPPADGPYYTNLSALHGTIPNGTWGLYVFDGVPLDGGWITNWTLTINSGSADFGRLSASTNFWLGGAGFGGEVSFANGSMTSIEVATLDVTGTMTAGTLTATNMSIEGLTTTFTNAFLFANGNGAVIPTNNAGGLTNLSGSALIWPTNQATLTIDMGKRWAGLSTNANIAIAGFSGIDARNVNVQTVNRIYTNSSGSTKTIAMPAACVDLSNTGLTIYNTNQGLLTVTVYPGFGTNFSWLGK